MTLEEAMAYINRLNYTQMPRGLERIRRLLAALDNPQRSMKFVHVAGTNGKGSTVAFISTILKEAGYVVGMYISPGLMRYNERMTVNGEEIADEDLIRYVEIIRQAIKRAFDGEPFQPNFFEITLAMALLYYRDRGCNIAVLEVGLGGRLDATNIIEAPEAAVIMTIDFDHMAQLGHTLSAIAGEKAGIIKRGTEVVIYPQGEEAAAVIETKCREQEVHLHKVDLSRLILRGHTLKLQHFDYKTYGGLTLALLGDHQVKNAAVAIETIEVLKTRGFDISEETMRAGLMHTVWPARFECVNFEPPVIVDAAHNPEGAKLLKENLCQYFPDLQVFFILGVMADKAYDALIKHVMPVAARFYCVTADSERAMTAEALVQHIELLGGAAAACDSSEEAIRRAVAEADARTVICAFGSFYYIGQIRAYFGR